MIISSILTSHVDWVFKVPPKPCYSGQTTSAGSQIFKLPRVYFTWLDQPNLKLIKGNNWPSLRTNIMLFCKTNSTPSTTLATFDSHIYFHSSCLNNLQILVTTFATFVKKKRSLHKVKTFNCLRDLWRGGKL